MLFVAECSATVNFTPVLGQRGIMGDRPLKNRHYLTKLVIIGSTEEKDNPRSSDEQEALCAIARYTD